MNVNSWWMRGVCNKQDRSKPQASFNIHIRVPQVRTEVYTICGLHLVRVDTRSRWWSGKACSGGGCCKRRHTKITRVASCLSRKSRRGQRLLAKRRGCKGVNKGTGRRQWLVQVQWSRTLGKLPLCGLCRQVDVVILPRSWIQVCNPSFRQRWW